MSKSAMREYVKTITKYDKRYLPKRKTHQNWLSPGRVDAITTYEGGLRLSCKTGVVDLYWIAPDCLRVRFIPDHAQFDEPFSYAVEKTDWPPVEFDMVEGDLALAVTTSRAVYRIAKEFLRIGVETLGGKLLCVDTAGMQWREDGALRLVMGLQPDEACYGLGERAAGLNLRGKHVKLWNTDAPHYMRGTDPLYYSIPFYLGVHNHGAYGVFWDNPHRGLVDLGASKHSQLVFGAEAGVLQYYLFAGSDVKSVLSRYTELTGHITLPPLWALGYQQSRYSYRSQEEVLQIAATFRQRRIPCDVIYLDIHYMDGFRVFTVDSQHFPDFENLVEQLHEQGFKVITILDPGILIDSDYAVYQSGVANDVFLKYPDGERVVGVVWPGACHFPDFSSPITREWWAQQCAKLLQAGVDGIWNDMSEPAVFTENGPVTLPDYVQHDGDGRGGNHLAHHNTYGMLMARASAEALQQHRQALRSVNIVRSGYAGTQRYAMSWTGDNTASWDHLRLSLSMVLNMGLSGAPITGPDIGGFHDNCEAELLTRWLQAACLLPFYRNHTELGTRFQEPWVFGQPYEVINRITIELRYRFMPYLYSAIAQSKEYGWPVVRPIFMAEPNNPALRSIDDCYMVGDALLVAPVLEQGTARRKVYLPVGDWYDYWSSELVQGGREVEVTAPLERLPLFVRAGTILPLWPPMQYVGERSIKEMLLRVYPGNSETVLYEDDGESMAYAEGHYRWVYLSSHWEGPILHLHRHVAGQYQPHYDAIKVEVVGLLDEPIAVHVDRKGAPVWFFDDDVLDLTLDDSFRQIEIHRRVRPDDPTIARRRSK